ncbi:hypothetical protein KR093_004056, partial [Drosophila rubida]
MSLNLSKLLLFSWPILYLELYSMAQNNANLLCTQMMNTQLLEKCCGDSRPSNLPYENSNCEKYKDNYGACRYECIYNSFQLLHDNGSLHMPNVNKMVNKLYTPRNGYNSYRLMLLDAFEHCETLSASYKGLVEMYTTIPDPDTGLNSEGVKCKRNALIFAKCTTANMFLNCPIDFWQDNAQDCAYSRRLLAHCVRFLND